MVGVSRETRVEMSLWNGIVFLVVGVRSLLKFGRRPKSWVGSREMLVHGHPRGSSRSVDASPLKPTVSRQIAVSFTVRTPDVAPQFKTGGENGLSHSFRWRELRGWGRWVLACPRSRSSSGPNSARAGRRAPPAPRSASLQIPRHQSSHRKARVRGPSAHPARADGILPSSC
jgi:hypothetical protein